ncbi:3-oxoacyl-ACP reductase FabG [Nonomuraea sp. NPDC052116]|uniref:3-oxoacyl-ACP reductase FabG n=1 Tax=Nonomuraea sp. NPDC052116 TaxID=3155665 RepID=UPI00344A13DA
MLFPADTVALVTGAVKGIGRAVAVDLAHEGANVIVNYRQDEEAAKETVRLIEAAGGQATALRADISDEKSVSEMFRRIRQEYGRLDVLVANAGVARDRHLITMGVDRFREVMDVNLIGTFLTCREAVRLMERRRCGSIVTISSAIGIYGGLPGQTNYAASKGGIIAFSKTLAHEVSRRGIRVNTVAPGFVETEMTNALPVERRKEYTSRIGLGRMAQPAEVAYLVSFLASSRGSYITGSVFEVHGGGFEAGDIQ